MRVLQTLVKEFDGFVGDGVGHVYKLMLLLQRFVKEFNFHYFPVYHTTFSQLIYNLLLILSYAIVCSRPEDGLRCQQGVKNVQILNHTDY